MTTSANNNKSDDSGNSTLSKLILEGGYECCNSVQSVETILAKINKTFTEKDIAKCLGCMAGTYTNMAAVSEESSDESNWVVENFVSVVKEKTPNLDWYKVVENLDYEQFFVYDARGLDILVRAWNEYSKTESFPANIFFGQWKNLKGQLSALYQMAGVSTERLNLVDCSKRKVIELKDLRSWPQDIQAMATSLATATQLNSLDLFESVINMADTVVADDVSVFIEMMAHKSPELVFIALIQIQPIKSSLHRDMLRRLLLTYLNGTPRSVLALTRLWQINPDFLTKSLLELYNKDATTVTRILDIVHELKILPQMLNVHHTSFAIDLAALASRSGYIDLEKWLQGKVVELKDTFACSCLEYLAQKISSEMSRQETDAPPTTIPLSLQNMATLLKVLSESHLPQENAEMLKEVQSVCLQTYPKLMNIRTQATPGSTGGEVSFKPEVEQEANSYYEQIYSGKMTMDEMIDRLKTLSKSKIPKEQDIFACMIHNLFDEYHFFPNYPDKELTITSILFGSLIQHQLVSYVPLGIALRCVLDALGNPPGNKMYNFGTQALAQFQRRLPEWPQYCTHLLQIPHLQRSSPDLVRLINIALQNHQATTTTTAGSQDGAAIIPNPAAIAPLPMDSTREGQQQQQSQPTIFASIHVPDLPTLSLPETDDDDRTTMETLNLRYQTPSESIQDKILFIINNVAHNNLDTKLTELKDVLCTSSYYKWFSNYLVVKRASIEPNYHDLYLLLLDAIDSRLLREHVLRETYVNIQILLNSEKTVSSSSERSLLKNLGSWLGGMTLARNKPIRHKNISFKELLLEGYDSNRLIVVIPFVCKVLEQCSSSKIFKPPNPWVMAVLKLLVELYEYADLKLNLKFEIEVLCKSLSLELKEIEATSILKNRQPRDSILRNSIVDNLARGDTSLMMPNAERSPIHNQVLPPNTSHDGGMDDDQFILPDLAPYITFNSQIILYSTQPASKRLVLQAINKSIREIIEPVVDRSVAIAAVSTRELVGKDFAMESDENKMRKAAHLMAQNLAGNLAMVTCKEPLRLSLVTNLRNIFLASGLAETMIDQTAHLTVSDNLDLVCAVIEKAAMEKATHEVDEQLMAAFANRKKFRDQHTGQPYYDMDMFSSPRYPVSLPEPLRVKPDGLQANHLRIYEDFSRVSRIAPPSMLPQMDPASDLNRGGRTVNHMDSSVAYVYPGNMATGLHNNDGGNIGSDVGLATNQVSAHQIVERFAQYITDLEKLVVSPQVAQFATFQALPPMHNIRVIIRQVPLLALSSFDKVEAARTFAQKVVQQLYKSESHLAREMYVVLLKQLCDVSPDVGALVTQWLTHADDERKYNVPVTVVLIKAGLINLVEQDQELALLIGSGRTSAIDFTARLIRACLFGSDGITSVASQHDFATSLDAFSRLQTNVPDSVMILLDQMRRYAADQQEMILGANSKDGPGDDMNLREQLQFLFAEWVHLVQHPNTTEKVQENFITQLLQHSIFTSDDMSSLFYRVCLEASVQHALKYKQMNIGPSQIPPMAATSIAYQPIDAFSKLVVGILLQQQQQITHGTSAAKPSPSSSAKLSQFNRILLVITLVLAQHHDQQRQQFDQRCFLRLFTSMLTDLHVAENQFQNIYIPTLITMANTFHTLQPSNFPGFSFAWLQLISHRFFMPKLLLAENQKGWSTFEKLLVSLVKFMVPFLQHMELKDTTRLLYRGTMRVLLVLLHDFPEFLCDYHYSLCDVIPPTCIQLRNLILSAFPRNMRLPDPFTPNLKVDLLPDTKQSPRILSDYEASLESFGHFKMDIDRYLLSEKSTQHDKKPAAFLSQLVDKLAIEKDGISSNGGENMMMEGKYNVSMINALVFYIAVTSISQNIPGNQGAAIEIYQHLLVELDSEGRYLFLSAIANQLRYPNSHTHYFSCVLLYLFVESNKEIIKEQITRVLLERLIVNRPHPWGLLITFIELIKNPGYNFWNHSFTRCATDIERLFESVSRSINQI